MMEMKEFQEKLEQLLEQARRQGKNLTKEEILRKFGRNQLSTQQLQSMYEYLRVQGIRIQGIELKKMEEPQLIALGYEDEACLKEYREYQKLLNPEGKGEREKILKAYAKGDSSVLERITQLYLPEILEMARCLYREGVFLGDLIQEGNMSILTAPAEEMPKENADAWMKDQIRQGMENWLDEQAEQKLRDDSMVEKVKKLEAAIRELSDDENQKFSIEELSAYLEMDEEEIRAVLNLTGEGAGEESNDM